MIVEVVLGEVGKAGRAQLDAVDAALVDAVRAGLERQMGHTHVGQAGDHLGDVTGVRRGQPRGRQLLVGLARLDPVEHPGRTFQPSLAKIWRQKPATEVLPLVPVTATHMAGCLPQNAADARA